MEDSVTGHSRKSTSKNNIINDGIADRVCQGLLEQLNGTIFK